MDYEKKIEIPFGAFDSELIRQEISIPNGFKAVIDGNKIILTKIESEDERIIKILQEGVNDVLQDQFCTNRGVSKEKVLSWLEKQGETYTKKDVADLNEFIKEYSFNIPSDIYNFLPKEKQSAWINEIENAIKAGAQWAERQGESYTKRDVDDAYIEGMAFAKHELEKQGDSLIKWNKNTKDNKPQINHSVLMKTTHGIAEGEWQGEHWHQYRWAALVRDADVLSWMELSDLEKQSEQKSQRMISAEAKEAMYGKPANTVEQKCEESKTKIFDAPTPFEDKLYAFVAACEFLTLPAKIEFIKEHSQELLDTAKEQIEKEETEWTKEDEHTLQGVIDEIQANKNQAPDYDLATYDRFLSWLKSLKTKVQPKQEWSEKDEEELEIAIDTLKESGRYDSAKWVQSLKQRIGG